MTSIAQRALFALITIVIVFGAVEAGLSLSGWPNAESAFEHNEPFWVVDPELNNKSFPHKEESTTFLVSTNADGLRAANIEPDNSASKHRIMTLGCSTTFGWGVADAETYPARLQHYIDTAGTNNVEVINGGQPGYTSFQGSWLWGNTLKHYAPDVVLIGYVVQDARKAAYTDKSQAILQKDSRFLKDNFLYRSKIYLALRSALGAVQIRAKERGSGDEGGVYRVPPQDYVDNLRGLISAIKGQGGKPILFGYPLERSGYTGTHRKILAAAAAELDVSIFDPQVQMEAATRSGDYYFRNDRGHANAAGNDLIAQWVFEFLRDNAFLEASK